ncbi:MAG TPA: hypothetical protein VEG30_18975 [Terriglobales bacterium]|nr:hypothetical protein [Terriglobales bacterium]
MKFHRASVLLALLTILILTAGLATASDNDKDSDQGRDHATQPQWRDSDERHWYVRGVSARDQEDEHPHGNAHGNPHHDRDGDHDRDDHWASYGYREGTPPGWGQGQKKGWGNCGMPPGQAKKYGCTNYVYQGKQYEVFHDEDGHYRWRPHVSAHGSVDVHY